MTVTAWIILLIVVAAALVVLAAWFFERATNEVSLVRTGIGGRKVVIEGGTLAIPYFHQVSRVNMQTIRMEVHRTGEASLITKDRMRVDVGAEFYASVIPEADPIARAAQTLGNRTFHADQLKSLVDGMMVDALRAVAARMTMDELHENRGAFAAEVHGALKDTMARYGLQLDSVSLTDLDQTPFSALDENNAFNAVGMRRLAEIIADSKKTRARIEGDSAVAVREAEVEANRRKLEIELEQRRAEIAQTQEIEMLLAAQLTEVARHKAQAEREAAHARIRMEQDVQSASIAREQAIREAEIAQNRALDLAEQDRAIVSAAKSREGSEAEAAAKKAREAVVEAEENLKTLQQLAEAERRRKLALMAAEQEAEANAARVRITSEADKVAAAAKGEIGRQEAETHRVRAEADAKGVAARIAAENGRSAETVSLELEKARLEAMPKIIAEMVKPAEKIRGININHVTGLGGGGNNAAGPVSPINQTVDSILEMAVSLPAMKRLGETIGIDLESALETKPKDGKAGS
ncbi:flotillin family protein [Citreimonas sp.]|uniref:flotillin family protein n=1 Tax=Citreimonas sp. TaxID=3036715 RepID=UPI0035C7E0CE